MENVYENVGSARKELQITPKIVREVLEKMYMTCTSGEQNQRIQEAKVMSNNDAVETMILVFPIVIEIKTQVLDELNLPFEKGTDGLKEFLKHANYFSHKDEHVREIFMKLRDLYLPRFEKPDPENSSFTFTADS